MEKRHNVAPLVLLCLPVVVPTLVDVFIWAEQMPFLHRLHVSRAACMLTRPRSKSQQRNSGYYEAGTDRFAALSRPVLRLLLQPIRYSSDIYLFSVCKYSTIIQFDRVYLAHQSDGAVVSNLE